MDAANPRAGPAITALLIALPMVAVLAAVVQGATNADPTLWSHLTEYVLARVTVNTAVLVVGVVAIAVTLGTSLAWLTAACEFPGRGFFAWALLLPMAVPAYVLAFVAVATLDYAGAIPTALRGLFGRSVGDGAGATVPALPVPVDASLRRSGEVLEYPRLGADAALLDDRAGRR